MVIFQYARMLQRQVLKYLTNVLAVLYVHLNIYCYLLQFFILYVTTHDNVLLL